MEPSADHWVITPRERAKYQEQFKSLQPNNGIVTGAQARGFFLQSQLTPSILGEIWALADTDSDGKMNINEFSIACKLINLKLRGFEIPKMLPPILLASVASFKDTPSTVTPTGTGTLSPSQSIIPNNTAILPPARPIIPPQPMKPMITPTTINNIGAIVPPPIPPMPNIPSQIPLQQQQPLLSGLMGTTIPQSNIMMQQQQTILPSTIPPNTQQFYNIHQTKQPPPIIPMNPLIPSGIGGLSGQPSGLSGSGSGGIQLIDQLISTQSNDLLSSLMTTTTTTSGSSGIASSVSPALPAPPTPPQSGTPIRSMSIADRAPSIESPSGQQTEWAIKGPIKLKYTQLFNTTDRTRSGYLTGSQARNLMVQTKLPQAILAQIWAMADMDSDGRLGCEEFVLAMYLCDMAIQGEPLPTKLPPELIPPSFRKTILSRHGSIAGGIIGGVGTGSRHGSVSSQGGAINLNSSIDIDPLAGLPGQASFEDKRKENFDKGQAELERRRKVLQDIQRKEQEERERKEREENEKREKARLELERKQQEELERQLQRQREIEQEKEEKRKREIEQKEAARKEMEKQRQLEWEKQRIAEMQLQRQREQDKVLKLKAQNQVYNVELSTLNEKIKDLSQRICDTRSGVTNVKTVIDGMRTTRDIQMNDMSHLKIRIKEQNQKLVQLSQEKAKLDNKTKSGNFDNSTQEQMNVVFSNKQIVIGQLKDKLQNTKKDLDIKKNDVKANVDQLNELKNDLSELIGKCEEIYTDYDERRNYVIELKNTRKNESITSAWDTSASAWPIDNTIKQQQSPEQQYSITGITTNPITATTTTAAATAGGGTTDDYNGFIKYRAIYEFTARTKDEIAFQPGDIIMVPLEQNGEPGWLAGEINGQTGWFPESYVEKCDDTRQYDDIVPQVNQMTLSDTNIIATNGGGGGDVGGSIDYGVTGNSDIDVEYYISTYPYQSAEVGDLVFDAGEYITVTKKEGDWWTGTIGSRSGIFPSNYVQRTAQQPMTTNTISDLSNNNIINEINNKNNIYNINNNNTNNNTHNNNIKNNNNNNNNNNNINNNNKAFNGNNGKYQIDNLEEAKNQEDADTEVYEINIQRKSSDQIQETYSRPMSTSSTTTGVRSKKGEVAQVIAPYDATSTEQLSLQRGQLIMIRKKTESGWWEGELQARGKRRQIGWFPATYVKVLTSGRLSGRSTPVSGGKIQMNETVIDKVIALYPYKAQNDDELSFEKDDIISVLGRDEPEWWRGECQGLTGLFPSNYVGPFVTSGNV